MSEWERTSNGDTGKTGLAFGIKGEPVVIGKVYGTGYPIGYGKSPQSEANVNLIVGAVNACLSVNPSNPLAAAEGYAGVVEALERAIMWLRRLEFEYPGCLNNDAIEKRLEPALAKIGRG